MTRWSPDAAPTLDLELSAGTTLESTLAGFTHTEADRAAAEGDAFTLLDVSSSVSLFGVGYAQARNPSVADLYFQVRPRMCVSSPCRRFSGSQ